MRLGQTYTTKGGNAFVVVDIKPTLITTENIGHDGVGAASVKRKAGDIVYIRPKTFEALLREGHYEEEE